MTLTKHIKLSLIAFAVSMASLLGSPAFVAAQNCGPAADNFLGMPTWYKYLDRDSDCNVTVEFPDSIPAILLAVVEILLRVAGIVAVIFVIYGGFQYLITTGEPEKAKNARTTIINALVGMLIAMFATVGVSLIARNL